MSVIYWANKINMIFVFTKIVLRINTLKFSSIKVVSICL